MKDRRRKGENWAQKKRRQLTALFHIQGGKCFWCKCDMLPPGSHENRRGVKPPLNLATYDHMDDRHSPERGKHAGEFRNVAACWKCNFERGRQGHLATPIEQRRMDSKRHPTPPDGWSR